MARILIAGKDWTSRALLRAQLIEEGFDVEAYESAQAADNRLSTSRNLPQLLIVDLFESENPEKEVSMLTQWTKLLPIWILAGHGSAEGDTKTLKGRGVERILFRPLDVGKLVEEIKERVAG